MNSAIARTVTSFSQIRSAKWVQCRWILWLFVWVSITEADEIRRSRSSIERMRPDVLEATRKSVARLQALRVATPPVPGLQDYRAIFHAHAEDSVHTGGTRPEMLADAIKAGVKVIFLSDHYRPPRDFISDSWRGLKEGVLFIPGSEVRGFLAHPTNKIMELMDRPVDEFVRAVGDGAGMIFLSHIEERPDHSMKGLTGMEVYNRHYDAKRDLAMLVNIALRLTDPKESREFARLVQDYPDEILAAQVRYSSDYFDKWDRESLNQRVVGIAANDCHHNQVLIVKKVDETTARVGTIVDKDESMRTVTTLLRPGLKEMLTGRANGDVVVRVDLDPYFRSFRNVSTHVFATELSESAIRHAVGQGQVYVSHDWMSDPTGFWYAGHFEGSTQESGTILMGHERRYATPVRLKAEFPLLSHVRWLRNGKVVHENTGSSSTWLAKEPGVYRVEAWLEIASEMRPWIYSNPIYLR